MNKYKLLTVFDNVWVDRNPLFIEIRSFLLHILLFLDGKVKC